MNKFRKLISRWIVNICLAITTFTCLAACSSNNKVEAISFVESSYDKMQDIEDMDYFIYFHREDCQYCKAFEEDLHSIVLNKNLKNTIYTLETSNLNTAQKKAIQEKYSIRFVPSLVMIKKGELIWAISGGTEKEELENYLMDAYE